MLRRIRCAHCAIVFCSAFLFPATLIAQVDRGSIVGAITDPSGARVSGAQVTVTNRETNQSTRVTSNDAGDYKADLLRIGSAVPYKRAGRENRLELLPKRSAKRVWRPLRS